MYSSASAELLPIGTVRSGALRRVSAATALVLSLLSLASCQPNEPAAAPCPPTAAPAPSAPQGPFTSTDAVPEDGLPHPIVRQSNYVIKLNGQELEVDPSDGGRIVAFRDGGANILVEKSESDSYGTSFWPSPQSDWHWPPPLEIAGAPYTTSIVDGALVLESQTNSKLGISAAKRISADVPARAIIIEYTLVNRGSAPRKMAPWQNSRVHPSGFTFYPDASPLYPQSTLKLEIKDGITFLQHDPAKYKQGVKSFGDGSEGWLAHAAGDLILIKSFEDVPKERQAPGESQIQIYVDGNGKFVEVEHQGPYEEVAPGQSLSWTVRWYLRRLPSGVRAEPGNAALLEFVRSTVR